MPTFVAPASNTTSFTGGAATASDTYIYPLVTGTTTNGVTTWSYPAAGTWRIASDSYGGQADTITFRTSLPSSSLLGAGGWPVDQQNHKFVELANVQLIWKGYYTAGTPTQITTLEDFRAVVADERSTPANMVFEGFNKNLDNLTYEETWTNGTQTQTSTDFSRVVTGNAGVILNGTPTTTSFSRTTATAPLTGVYQWVYLPNYQSANSNLLKIDQFNSEALTAYVQRLSNVTTPTEYRINPSDVTAANISTGTVGGGAIEFGADLMSVLNASLPNTRGNPWNPQDDVEVTLVFDRQAFKDYPTDLTLQSQVTFRDSGNAELNYEILLDPTATVAQNIREMGPVLGPNSRESDAVRYSSGGINTAGAMAIVDGNEQGNPSLFRSNSSNYLDLKVGLPTFSSGMYDASVTRNFNLNGSQQSITDHFEGIETFILSAGNDQVTVETSNNNNYGGNALALFGLSGADQFTFVSSAPANGNPYTTDRPLKTVFINSAEGFDDRNGVIVNFSGTNLTLRDGTTQLSSSMSSFVNSGATYANGTANFTIRDAYGFTDSVQFQNQAFVENLYFEGSQFGDAIILGETGARGRYENILVNASRGTDTISVRKDPDFSNGILNFDAATPTSTNKLLTIQRDFSDLKDYMPVSSNSQIFMFGTAVYKDGFGNDYLGFGRSISLNEIRTQFGTENNYVEFDTPRLNTDDTTVMLGAGQDQVYIDLPFLSNTGALGSAANSSFTDAVKVGNQTNIANAYNIFLGWDDGNGDGNSDRVEIDLSNIQKLLNPNVYGAGYQPTRLNEINLFGFETGSDTLNLVKGDFASNYNVVRSADNNSLLIQSTKATPETLLKINFLSSFDENTGNATAVSSSSVNYSMTEERTVQQFARVNMTEAGDAAVLHEDSGIAGIGTGRIYDFRGGDDDVLLYRGDLQVALGAGNDYARVSGGYGDMVVIGNAGRDGVSLYGSRDNWEIKTLTTTQAAQLLADMYGSGTPTVTTDATGKKTIGQFGIEQDAADLSVVYMAINKDSSVYPTGADFTEFAQTVLFQTEFVDFSESTASMPQKFQYQSEELQGAMEHTLDMAKDKVALVFNGRRATEDSITIKTDTSGVMSALQNVRQWLDTTTTTEARYNGSVLDGSHVNLIHANRIVSSNAAFNVGTAVVDHKFVDIEKIVVTDGSSSNTFTFRIAGSNGYSSVEEAVNSADYGDIIFVAEKIENILNNNPKPEAVAGNGATSITVKSGLGVVFEAADGATPFEVTVNNQIAAIGAGDVPNIPGMASVPVTPGSEGANGDVELNGQTRVTFLLGDNKVNVQGSDLADLIIGNRADNVIRGGAGNDMLFGGAGNDLLLGQSGDDTLLGSAGRDYLNGGSGDDSFLAHGTTRTSATSFDVQTLVGGSGNDSVALGRNSGQINIYLGSGKDEVITTRAWFENFKTSTANGDFTVTRDAAKDPLAKILDFSTVSDSLESFNIASKLSDTAIEADLAKVNVSVNQLISPPNPIDTAHQYVLTDSLDASANLYSSPVLELPSMNDTVGAVASIGEVLESYRLANG